ADDRGMTRPAGGRDDRAPAGSHSMEVDVGCVYPRKKQLWLKYKDAEGNWVCRRAGLPVGHEREAELVLKKIESFVASGAETSTGQPTPCSLASGPSLQQGGSVRRAPPLAPQPGNPDGGGNRADHRGGHLRPGFGPEADVLEPTPKLAASRIAQ